MAHNDTDNPGPFAVIVNHQGDYRLYDSGVVLRATGEHVWMEGDEGVPLLVHEYTNLAGFLGLPKGTPEVRVCDAYAALCQEVDRDYLSWPGR